MTRSRWSGSDGVQGYIVKSEIKGTTRFVDVRNGIVIFDFTLTTIGIHFQFKTLYDIR